MDISLTTDQNHLKKLYNISSTSQELLISVGIEFETHLNKCQSGWGQPWLKKSFNKEEKIISSSTITSAY